MNVPTPMMKEYLHIPLVLNVFSLRLQAVCIFLDSEERWTNGPLQVNCQTSCTTVLCTPFNIPLNLKMLQYFMYLKCIFVADCLTFYSIFVLYTYNNTLCMCNVFQFTSVMNIKGDNYRKYFFLFISSSL